MVIDRPNLKLRQIARFSSNVVLDEMSSTKCRLLFGISFSFIAQQEERPLYHVHMVTSRLSFVFIPNLPHCLQFHFSALLP